MTDSQPLVVKYRLVQLTDIIGEINSVHGQGVEKSRSDERDRLKALNSYKILDTDPESAFDDIVTIASEICAVPMALISLVDSKRQWFKAAVGLDVSETPREVAFCAHAIQQESTFVVQDATADSRFSANPLVTGSPNLRFYAGTPLRTVEGDALGTLCVLDTQPRKLTAQQHAALQALGRQVMQLLEYRKALLRERETEQRNQLILDSAVDYAIITMDLEGQVTSWNEGARRILGWSSDEMRGQRYTAFFSPEDREAQIPDTEMGEALSHGRAFDERWHLRKDGSRFFASGEMMVLKEAAHQPVGFLKMLRDRTAQKRASETEPALLELSDRLSHMTDIFDMSLVAAELIGRTLHVNRAGFGTADDRNILRVDRDWTQPGVHSIAGDHDLQAFGSYTEELQHGAIVTIADTAADERANASVLKRLKVGAQINCPVIEQGKMVAIFFAHSLAPREWERSEVEFVREVAQRTRLAIERRRAEGQLRLLADSLHLQVEQRTRERDRAWRLSQDLMVVSDLAGTLLTVNHAWHTLLGWDEHDLVGTHFAEFTHPDDLAATRAVLAGIVDAPLTRPFEYRLRHKGGDYRWFAWTATLEGDRVYASGRHTTAEHEQAKALQAAETALRQSQKMEAVGQLTGGLAHDFNNLLAGITGSLEMLAVRLRQGRFSEIERYVHAAQDATRRAAALTHRLLAFSRRQTLDPKPTDVNRLVAGMSDLVQRTMGPEVSLETVTAAGLWNTLIDPGQLENALLNLCINARDAMPKGGKLTLETGNKWIDERTAQERDITAGQYITLSVSDTGAGMSQETIARAFDPFFTTKPIGMGTGLGLSMVYGFARQSGGQVRIYSEVNQGTTVCLYLPRYMGEATDRDEDLTTTGVILADQTASVLVVDDEPTVRMLMVDVLQEMGCIALEAADAAAGLRLLDSGARVDLLITDVGLPAGMNGRQLADAARLSRPALKVLFITGYAENAVLRHGHLEQGMHVLTKPFTIDDLVRRIKALLSGSSSRTQ